MKITLVYRYFPPDSAPYGQLLASMLPAITEAGHQVRVLAGQPAYGSEAKSIRAPKYSREFGCHVERISLLPGNFPLSNGLNFFLFPLLAFIRIVLGPRTDICWSGTMPAIVQPFLIGMAARLRGARFLYQMQDIHPDILIHAGQAKEGLLAKLVRAVDNMTIRMAHVVTVLSADMAKVVEARTGVAPLVINNSAMGIPQEPLPDVSRQGPLRFVFAGNIGQFQNLEALLDTFFLVPPGKAELHFVGDGKMREALERKVRENAIANVFFHGRMPPEDAFRFIRQFDVGVVTLAPGLYQLAYPSKTNTYLAAGLFIFACLEQDSEMAAALEKYGVGTAVGWDRDPAEIAAAMTELASFGRKQLHKAKPDSRSLWQPEAINQRWLSLLEEQEAD